MAEITGAEAGAVIVAFAGVVSLWWIYFDRSAEAGAQLVATSSDPGRLGRSAYHFIHPIMVAGIIVTAAADERLLADPTHTTTSSTAWLILGGTALYLAGHAAFKATVWRTVPWTRLSAILGLALLGLAATSLPALALGGTTAAIVVLVASSDREVHSHRQQQRNTHDTAPTPQQPGRP